MTRERLSLVNLAKVSKVPKQTLHNWLCGAEPKSLDQVRAVCLVFDMSIEELCYGENSPTLRKNLTEYEEEINAGIFEVVLRRVKK